MTQAGPLIGTDQGPAARTTLPVSRTPLDILLRASIPLSGPVVVTALDRPAGFLRLSLAKSDAPGQGTLTLRFSDNPLALVGVTIRDRFGQVTMLDLSHLVRDPEFGAGRFDDSPATQPAAQPGA